MQSRTAEGKHTKRFIIEAKIAGDWTRSGNSGIRGFFETREAAKAAMEQWGSSGIEYRVRQK